MTAEGTASSQIVSCEHRNKKSLFRAKEVRKKLKTGKTLCEECERAVKDGDISSSKQKEVLICVTCGYLTCSTHAKKHCEAARTGEKHSLFLNLENCQIRCEACATPLSVLDDPQDPVRLFCNEYRSFSKTRSEPKITRKPPEHKQASCNGVSQPQQEESNKLSNAANPALPIEVSRTDKNSNKRSRQPSLDDTMIPAKGLANLGNTCFFNSVMQCMMHTHQLTDYFNRFGKVTTLDFRQTHTVVVNEEKVNLEPATISVPLESAPLNSVLRGFIAEFQCGASPSPGSVFSQISCKTPRFKGYQQQDAHELLRYLLDGLRSEEMERYKAGIASYFGVSPKISRNKVSRAISLKACEFGSGYLQAAGRPLLDMVFGGTLLQTILCSECGHVSERHEQFLDLSIPVTLNGSIRSQRGNSIAVSNEQLSTQGKKRGRGKRKVAIRNDDYNEDRIISPPERRLVVDDNGYSDDDMERLVAGVNRLDFTKVLVCPPEEYRDGACSIGSCLLEFTAPEELQGANAYECEKCCGPRNKKMNAVGTKKKRVSALKRYLIYEPPAVLTLHLKRFQQLEGLSGRKMAARKLSGHVDFPTVFDMAPFCCRNVERIAPGEKRLLYSLYGVVVHSGSLSGGHYIAYVKSRHRLKQAYAFLEIARNTCVDALSHPVRTSVEDLPLDAHMENDGQWYYCSDSQVMAVPENRVLSAEAYILFYERVL
ncbi:unnamed protein product [Cylicocyclus nassatus]|uniref:Ubiquitin carboxyl-terminal hydrolase n=1 Tax=Cylicocyclus nassatus TaxID=53992 RepID=A0AA36HAE8_CYLNA|nr:unnamed protein product [Cylicocyclus nassatus]